ncbi:hypothetical protein [Ideonella sp. BN130291]|uniref:hypothetical protein n=1 Tax=Ideonella sp. BN130291 TaxID=3112940 RepID=UPI002E26934F|nr:hypothetical protein [Ideonella sp. BN130291]
MTHAVLSSAPPSAAPTPWWRVKVMWLVLGGPVSVVLACAVTAVFIWHGSDRSVMDSIAPVVKPRPVATADAPALQARNHAATAAGR